MFTKFLVVATALLSTQVYANCWGLKGVERVNCINAVANRPTTAFEIEAERQQREASSQNNRRYVEALNEINTRRANEARIQQQRQAQEQALAQQQQAAYEQARRDAVAEATLQQLRYNAQQQEIANQQAAQQTPAPRRAIQCTNNGNGTSTCY